MHDILLLRISALLPEAISDGGLTPTTDTDLLLAAYRGGSHFTSDIFMQFILTANNKNELFKNESSVCSIQKIQKNEYS